MIDVLELKKSIKNNGYTIGSFAKVIKMDASTFYRKLSKKGDAFTVGEVKKIAKQLGLSNQEAKIIFFNF